MPTDRSVVRSGEPINEDGRTYLFATNLAQHLDGELHLRFYPNDHDSEGLGWIRIETRDGRKFLLIVQNVSYLRFSQLGEDLGWHHQAEGKGRFIFCNYSETT